MTVVCEDESIFVYDSVVRKVWARKGTSPIVVKTGSHKKTCVFGSVSSDGRQLFRQARYINGGEFVKYVKELKRKFGKFLLFIDGAPWHRRKCVSEYFERNKDSISPIFFPRCSPELDPVEECWKQAKNDVVGNTVYPTFEELKHEIAKYFRTKRFKLDVVNYLCP